MHGSCGGIGLTEGELSLELISGVPLQIVVEDSLQTVLSVPLLGDELLKLGSLHCKSLVVLEEPVGVGILVFEPTIWNNLQKEGISQIEYSQRGQDHRLTIDGPTLAQNSSK